ncbi:FAD-dependent oxidoreductase [Ideonella azotifigens]|uniref:Tryptophan 2-monooxygenase n=2 Tax=Ideonella azotifigens TaxID=513160 RepID=A0ABN1KKC9_9BURK|nr:flavin monoamine oxidase family protein [Ideonella azotifigens]MCD2339345.1 FAD-dependent oxidoreductase [Ideonella azotifigens]
MPGTAAAPTRRDWLGLIARAAGSGAMLQAMSGLAQAQPSGYAGPPKLQGAPRGARVLVLGAGMAGLVSALELRAAGYQVQVLEYQQRAGGRAWTLRGGDRYTELGGATQHCQFDPGLYFNPGPWRIPHHHHGVLDYAKRFQVPLEPFVQVNHNAYLHSLDAFGGRPQRFREVQADFNGQVAELLARLAPAAKLDAAVSKDDLDQLREALRGWGALDKDFRYTAGFHSADRRGWQVPPAGGLMPAPVPSQPVALSDLLKSGLWRGLADGHGYEYQTTMFQPVGGMDRIAQAIYREVAPLVTLDAKVTGIAQDGRGVTVRYLRDGASEQVAQADWCVCTLPLSVLGQLALQVQPALQAAIEAVPYAAAVKVGLQFRRRFWEEDERIFGGNTRTDLPITQIGYPSTDFNRGGKGVLLGAYVWGPNAFELSGMAPEQRVRIALEQGARIHPQYPAEFENGMSVAWHRMPATLGCFAEWRDELRAAHYANLCAVDGRVVLAGEHASLLPAWQEGAVLSALDAVGRLHAKAVATS